MIQYAIGNGPIEYEVFDPRDGSPIVTTRSLWLARTLAEYWGVDFERSGRGWARRLIRRRRENV